jgi:hypothetical protein
MRGGRRLCIAAVGELRRRLAAGINQSFTSSITSLSIEARSTAEEEISWLTPERAPRQNADPLEDKKNQMD